MGAAVATRSMLTAAADSLWQAAFAPRLITSTTQWTKGYLRLLGGSRRRITRREGAQTSAMSLLQRVRGSKRR